MAKRYKEGLLPFKIVPTDEPLVARSGLLLPYEMAKALKLPRVIDKQLPRPGSGRGYKPSQFVIPLILMFHSGGKKLEGLREIKGEMSLRELVEMERLPASCTITIGDWLRRMGQDGEGLCGLGKVNHHLVSEVIKREKRNNYTLDVDASIIESEKAEAKVTYKGEKGYQPQMGFLFEVGLVLEDEFREGNIPAQAGAISFLERCFAAMPTSKSIGCLRSDSALYQAGVINLCLERKVRFTITADQDKGTRDSIKAIKEWRPYQGDKEIGETIHTMNNTKGVFRLIVLRWPKLQAELFDSSPYFYHAIATNREETAEEVIKLHNQRGEVENYIKELKSGFGMNWMPCGETNANAVFFRIGVIAYNLFLAMKLFALPPWYRTFTISTVRWRLYQAAGAVVRHAHQLFFSGLYHANGRKVRQSLFSGCTWDICKPCPFHRSWHQNQSAQEVLLYSEHGLPSILWASHFLLFKFPKRSMKRDFYLRSSRTGIRFSFVANAFVIS